MQLSVAEGTVLKCFQRQLMQPDPVWSLYWLTSLITLCLLKKLHKLSQKLQSAMSYVRTQHVNLLCAQHKLDESEFLFNSIIVYKIKEFVQFMYSQGFISQ